MQKKFVKSETYFSQSVGLLGKVYGTNHSIVKEVENCIKKLNEKNYDDLNLKFLSHMTVFYAEEEGSLSFDINTLSKELMELLTEAGVTRQDLKDPEKVQFILTTLMETLGEEQDDEQDYEEGGEYIYEGKDEYRGEGEYKIDDSDYSGDDSDYSGDDSDYSDDYSDGYAEAMYDLEASESDNNEMMNPRKEDDIDLYYIHDSGEQDGKKVEIEGKEKENIIEDILKGDVDLDQASIKVENKDKKENRKIKKKEKKTGRSSTLSSIFGYFRRKTHEEEEGYSSSPSSQSIRATGGSSSSSSSIMQEYVDHPTKPKEKEKLRDKKEFDQGKRQNDKLEQEEFGGRTKEKLEKSLSQEKRYEKESKEEEKIKRKDEKKKEEKEKKERFSDRSDSDDDQHSGVLIMANFIPTQKPMQKAPEKAVEGKVINDEKIEVMNPVHTPHPVKDEDTYDFTPPPPPPPSPQIKEKIETGPVTVNVKPSQQGRGGKLQSNRAPLKVAARGAVGRISDDRTDTNPKTGFRKKTGSTSSSTGRPVKPRKESGRSKFSSKANSPLSVLTSSSPSSLSSSSSKTYGLDTEGLYKTKQKSKKQDYSRRGSSIPSTKSSNIKKIDVVRNIARKSPTRVARNLSVEIRRGEVSSAQNYPRRTKKKKSKKPVPQLSALNVPQYHKTGISKSKKKEKPGLHSRKTQIQSLLEGATEENKKRAAEALRKKFSKGLRHEKLKKKTQELAQNFI